MCPCRIGDHFEDVKLTILPLKKVVNYLNQLMCFFIYSVMFLKDWNRSELDGLCSTYKLSIDCFNALVFDCITM